MQDRKPEAADEALVRIGTAGWSVGAAVAAEFPAAGSHLSRYAARLHAVEINSSFYRPHRQSTYARWAGSVPEAFRFAVKVPRAVTHEGGLRDAGSVDRFAAEVAGLGATLGPLLVQLPPSLPFDPAAQEAVLTALQVQTGASLVCEPRHASWFTAEADGFLAERHIARVAADPAPAPGAGKPGGWRALAYHRWHGTPRTYYSDYDAATLAGIAERLRKAAAAGIESWCVFDNTALGHALGNALTVARMTRTTPH